MAVFSMKMSALDLRGKRIDLPAKITFDLVMSRKVRSLCVVEVIE